MKRLAHPSILACGLATILVGGTTFADETNTTNVDPRKNAIGLGPSISLVQGMSLSYERMLGEEHALNLSARHGFQSIADAIFMWKAGLMVGYRWHWSGGQDSGFVGVDLGAFTGEGTRFVLDDNSPDPGVAEVSTYQVALIGSVGRRFAWDNGFNITLRVGAGVAAEWFTATAILVEQTALEKHIDDLNERSRDEFTDWLAYDAELSIGYSF